MSAEKKTITGEISGIKYKSADGWGVFTIHGQSLPFTGILAEMVEVGSEVTCTGIIEVGKFGRQMKCESIVPSAPDISTDAGVAKLLQRLPGIGPKKAMMAVQTHGHKIAWELALTDPEKIGVHPGQAEEAVSISNSLLESYETTVYLLGIGLTDHQAATIQKVFGAQTIEIVSRDPYRLLQIDGFGFLTVDKIALKAGISLCNPSRISSCILYVINDSATNGGHVWHSGWKLSETVIETLNHAAIKAEVPMSNLPDIEQIRQQVHFLRAEKKISIDKGKVSSPELLRAELSILDFVGVEYA
jgi:exodeoxyribonuclease V alpha subunit